MKGLFVFSMLCVGAFGSRMEYTSYDMTPRLFRKAMSKDLAYASIELVRRESGAAAGTVDMSQWDCMEEPVFPESEWDCTEVDMSTDDMIEFDCFEDLDTSMLSCNETNGVMFCGGNEKSAGSAEGGSSSGSGKPAAVGSSAEGANTSANGAMQMRSTATFVVFIWLFYLF